MAHQNETIEQYLRPTAVVDSDNTDIVSFAEKVAQGVADPVERARRLFYAVRDDIIYDAKVPFYLPDHYVAGTVLKNGRGYCVQKACLLCAVARAVGIPSRLGFANIRNHGASKELVDLMGCDIFAYHGYTELLLNGNWVKVTPAFDMSVYEKHNIEPIEFDGRNDAVFPSHDRSGNPYVEYITYHETSADLPLDDLLAEWRKIYGEDRVSFWMDMFEEHFRSVSQPD
jgi:transglutaminase-like putative cysteine protease